MKNISLWHANCLKKNRATITQKYGSTRKTAHRKVENKIKLLVPYDKKQLPPLDPECFFENPLNL